MKQTVQRSKIDANMNLQLLNFRPGRGESVVEMRNAGAGKVQKVNF